MQKSVAEATKPLRPENGSGSGNLSCENMRIYLDVKVHRVFAEDADGKAEPWIVGRTPTRNGFLYVGWRCRTRLWMSPRAASERKTVRRRAVHARAARGLEPGPQVMMHRQISVSKVKIIASWRAFWKSHGRGLWQVGFRETNASEPLIRHRKV
jgi:hypothetical protein